MTSRFASKVFALTLPLLFPMDAQAGFQMTNSGASAAIEKTRDENIVPMVNDIPMNLVPMPTMDEQIPAQQVYIKRGGQVRTITPSADEAFNSEKLLNAVENGEPISWRNADERNKHGRVIINPYPLKDQAMHVHADQLVSLDQAMMEQSGLLRPVMTPRRTQPQAQPKLLSNVQQPNHSMDRIDSVELAPIAAPQSAQNNAAHIEGRSSKMMKQNINPYPSKQPLQNESSNQIFPNAAGFGRDLPLALALSQIVPSDYSYVFDGAVDTGAIVTWQGGKPWNIVLNDMLTQAGMVAVIQNNQVIVQKKNS